MRIASARIENFRSIKDETIEFEPFTALVGANGSGKSTVLAALNAFFGYRTDGGSDCSKLVREDFHLGDTSEEVRITLTFSDLGPAATELSHYARNDQLVVTARAAFDNQKLVGEIKHFGQRLGLPELGRYFDAEKNGASAADLKKIYAELRTDHPGLADVKTKNTMRDALRDYEESLDPAKLTLIPSEDNFYGSASTSGKLRPFLEWVYVPAVKDVSSEALESEGPALRALVARAITNRSDLTKQISDLKRETRERFGEILEASKDDLSDLSDRIQGRLQTWSKPDARVGMSWKDDGDKSVKLADPQASVQVGDLQFMGELSRQGHGLQRSYLLAVLEELSHGEESPDEDGPIGPSLVLGIEEPELYQHPPQAKRLSTVLESLAESGDQVIVTTHSPYFVHGESFENVRLVRRPPESPETKVSAATTEAVFSRVKEVHGDDTTLTTRQLTGAAAKLHQALTPALNEMFFCPRIVFVEGLEDVAYILSWIVETGRENAFIESEFEIIPCIGKGNIILPAVVADKLGIPTFLVFDGDSDLENHNNPGVAPKHRRDNGALAQLCGAKLEDGFPTENQLGDHFQVWKTNIGASFADEMSETLPGNRFEEIKNELAAEFGHTPDLGKNTLFVGALVERCLKENGFSKSLDALCAALCGVAAGAVNPIDDTPA